MKRHPASTVLLAALLGVALGCPERKPAPGPTDAVNAGKPQRGGTVVIGLTAALVTVNDLLSGASNVNGEVTRHLFLTLLEEQPDFEHHPPTFAPLLAQSYEWSADHKILTLKLRDDVFWSDGVPVTADDVRFTWQAQTHPDVAWENIHAKQAITDVEVVSPKVVRYHFSRAYAKQLLDVNEGYILPRHAWSKLPFPEWRQNADWFREHLVVSGPFDVESWNPQQQVVLKRNVHYFEPGKPYLDRVVLRTVSDQNALVSQLLSGAIDFSTLTSAGDAKRLSQEPRLEIRRYWSRTWVPIAWNAQHDPFSSAEIRRALTQAIDRQTIVETLWGEFARVTASPIGGSVWAQDPSLKPWPYDPAAARRIFAAQGFADRDGDGILERNGKPFRFEIITNAGNQQRVDALVLIQEQLKRVGIEAIPRQIEFNSMNAQINSGDFDALLLGLTMDTGIDLTVQLGSRALAGDFNFARYENPEMDRLIQQSLDQVDFDHAKPYLFQIQHLQHRDQPYTLLWESQRFHAINRRLRGAAPNVLFSLSRLQDWWVVSGR